MARTFAPAELVALAQERAAARAERDWQRADELRGRIEASGWRVIDSGLGFELVPARPADVVDGDRTFYGAVDSVPSRLAEPSTTSVTYLIVPGPTASHPDAILASAAVHRPPDSQLLLVCDRETTPESPAGEVVWTVEPFSPGDVLQAGLRRATGELVVVLDSDRRVEGDLLAPFREALQDPQVAAAGIAGVESDDLRRYQPASTSEATALRSGCYAFRRQDARDRGPIDGRLRLPGSVATWWTLTLRDEGPHKEPRRAVVCEAPVSGIDDGAPLPPDHDRLARRDAYRLAELIGDRQWLASKYPPRGRLVGDRAGGGDHDDGSHQEDDAGDP